MHTKGSAQKQWNIHIHLWFCVFVFLSATLGKTSYLISRIPCAVVISSPLIGSPCMTEAGPYVITLRILRGSNFYEHCWFCVTASEMEGTVCWTLYDCLLIWHFERLCEVRMATATFQCPVKMPLLACFPNLGTSLSGMLKSQKPYEMR